MQAKNVGEGRAQPARAMERAAFQFAVGFSLTAVAGYVDAVAFIEFGGIFASFMSGTSVSFGVGLSASQWAAVLHTGALVAVFVFAATTSTLLTSTLRAWRLPVVLLLEAICLAAALAMTQLGLSSHVAIIPIVAAMGTQNTALRPLNGVRLGVTFMTGTLVSLSEALGRSLMRRAGPWTWLPHGLVWCSFTTGAFTGAVAYMSHGFSALVAPTVGVAILLLVTSAAALFGRIAGGPAAPAASTVTAPGSRAAGPT